MAGGSAKCRESVTNVHHGRVHGAALRTRGCRGDCGSNRTGGAGFGVCAAARVFADTLRRGAGWKFSCVVRSPSSEASNSDAFASDARRRLDVVLYLSLARGHHHAGSSSYPVSVLVARAIYASAEASPGAEDARIPHAALSTSGIT